MVKWLALFLLFSCQIFASGLSTYGEYLHVKPTRSGLDYVAFDSATSPNDTDISVKYLDPDYKDSFRVGVFWEDCVSFEVIYTRIHSTTDEEPFASSSILIPTRTIAIDPLAFALNASFVFELDVVDLLLGYPLKVCDLFLRPFVGAKLGHISEQIEVLYFSDMNPFTLFTDQKNKLDVFGIQTGFDMSAPLFVPCLGLFFKTGASLLSTRSDQKWFSGTVFPPPPPTADAKFKRRYFLGVLECKVGLMWSVWTSRLFGVQLMGGYEFQSWRVLEFNNRGGQSGPLTQGLATLGFDGAFGRVHIAF